MYIPRPFAEHNPDRLHRFIQDHSFATLVSSHQSSPVATHLPLLLDRSAGTHGQLLGHMATANPQAKSACESEVLAIFHGPHAYISPTWYETRNAVPTWNYAAVHVYGTWRHDNSLQNKSEVVRKYVEFYESRQSTPWSAEQTDEGFVAGLLDAIDCFRIDIRAIEGCWKLNQHHDPERRQRVIEALEQAGSEQETQIAEMMKQTLIQLTSDEEQS